MFDVRKKMRSNILNLAPYSTARDEYQGDLGVYLDANENPYENGYNRYPDPHQIELKKAIAEIKGVSTESIFVGNGSDEAIDLVFRVFCEPRLDNVVCIAPSYGMYRVSASINDIEVREIQLESDFSVDVSKLLSACDTSTKAIFLCSPNNPTGNDIPREVILEVLEKFDGIVVVDEAYIDFSEQKSLTEDLKSYKNLIVLQTLSKAWGLAGLRLGLAFACEETITIMSRVKYPYNINVTTQNIVLQQLQQSRDVQIKEIITERNTLFEELKKLPIVKRVYPSSANFLLVEVEEPKAIYNSLIELGIIVRDRSSVVGCTGCLRITVGTPQENITMLNSLKKLSK